MLGMRLSPAEEARVTRFARAHGRKKSDVARQALNEFLDRNDDEDGFVRQARLIADRERNTPEGRRDVAEVDALAWRLTKSLG